MSIANRAPIVSAARAQKTIRTPFKNPEFKISAKVLVKIGPGTAPAIKPKTKASNNAAIWMIISQRLLFLKPQLVLFQNRPILRAVSFIAFLAHPTTSILNIGRSEAKIMRAIPTAIA